MLLTRTVATAEEMEALGGRMARRLHAGMVVYFHGNLGAGKTTLIRGILRGLGHGGAVKSPTYTLVEPYEFGARRVYHFDLYRLGLAEELDDIGLRDYLDAEALCLVEWPERGVPRLPPADLRIVLDYADAGRTVALHAQGARGESLLAAFGGAR